MLRRCPDRDTVFYMNVNVEKLKDRLHRHRQILFGKDDPFLAPVNAAVAEASGKAVILWALDLADETAEKLYEKYQDPCFLSAVADARLWARGIIRMPEAKRSILACHAFAREAYNASDRAWCHAVGQACSTVHTVRHAIGYPLYDLSALVFQYGPENCMDVLIGRRKEYLIRLKEAEKEAVMLREWALFIERREK